MTARSVFGILAIIVAVGGLYVLRANTMAREDVASRTGAALVVEFSVHAQLLPTHELPLVAESIFNTCRLQAEAGLESPVTRLSENRFRAVLSPAPNATDRKQLSGCLSDLTVAHTYSGDVDMREI